MIDQPVFGQKVRRARRLEGLSQSDLAGGDMSASYISLVESGRRTPSPELAAKIAGRLGVSLEELVAGDDDRWRHGRRMAFVGRLIAVADTRMTGDLATALAGAEQLAVEIGGQEDEDLRWETSWLLGQLRRDTGDLAGYETELRGLARTAFTAESPRLTARVAAARAELARSLGRLEESVALAEPGLAAIATSTDEDSAVRIALLETLALALAVLGDRRRAESAADDLTASIPLLASRSRRALARWSTVGVALLAGDPSRVRALLDAVVVDLDPALDPRRWAAAQRARVAAALSAGDRTAAAAALAQAGPGTELVGGPLDKAELAVLRVLVRPDVVASDDGLAKAAEDALTSAVTDAAVAPLRRAGLYAGIARVRAAAGCPAEAVAAYREAAIGYESCGAYRSASAVWREAGNVDPSARPVDPSAQPSWLPDVWPIVMLP